MRGFTLHATRLDGSSAYTKDGWYINNEQSISSLEPSLRRLPLSQTPSRRPLWPLHLLNSLILTLIMLRRAPRASARCVDDESIILAHQHRRLAANVNRAGLRFLRRRGGFGEVAVFCSSLFDPDITPALTGSAAFESVRLVCASLTNEHHPGIH